MEEITQFYTLNCSKVKARKNYILIKLDHIGLYYPKIYFYKFEYFKNIFEIGSQMEIDPIPVIDITNKFLELTDLNVLNFSFLGVLFEELLTHDEYSINNHKKYFKPLIKFFDYLGLDERIMELIISE